MLLGRRLGVNCSFFSAVVRVSSADSAYYGEVTLGKILFDLLGFLLAVTD